MSYIQCPPTLRKIGGCDAPYDYATFDGTCECGDHYDVSSDRVLELLMDALTRPVYYGLMAMSEDKGVVSIDYCTSYSKICDTLQDRIACPAELRVNNACINNQLTDFVGECECGGMTDVMSTRVAELVVDATLFEKVFNEYTFLSPPLAPMVQVLSSNPFMQMTAPLLVRPY